jgi:hypothetical protein
VAAGIEGGARIHARGGVSVKGMQKRD